jgi:hypothetical protein
MQVLNADIVNRTLKRKFPNIICENCTFFHKEEFVDGKWLQSQSYVVSLKYNIDVDMFSSYLVDKTIGDVKRDFDTCIEYLEKMLSVELFLSNSDSIPVLFDWD